MAYNTPRNGGFLLVCPEDARRRRLHAKMNIYRRTRPIAGIATGKRELQRVGRHWTALVVDGAERPAEAIALLTLARRQHPDIPIALLHDKPLTAGAERKAASLRVETVAFDEEGWPDLKSFLRKAVVYERCGANRHVADAVEELAKVAGLTIKQAELVALSTDTIRREDMAKELGVSFSTLVNRIYSLVDRVGYRSFDVIGKSMLRAAVERAAAEKAAISTGALRMRNGAKRPLGETARFSSVPERIRDGV